MGIVIFDISMSLDGFVTAASQSAENPMGPGGDVVHEWAFGEDPVDAEYMRRAGASTSAVICGRRTYDTSLPWWGADGPTGAQRKPVIVVTHVEPADRPADGVYVFNTGGVASALDEARAVAGDGDVTIMGGADIGRQYLDSGLVDELSIHVAPVIFGAGTRMFGRVDEHLRLSLRETVSTPAAVHLRYELDSGTAG